MGNLPAVVPRGPKSEAPIATCMCTLLHVRCDDSDYALGFATCFALPSRVAFACGGNFSTEATPDRVTNAYTTDTVTSVTTTTSATIGDWHGAVPTTTSSALVVVETVFHNFGCTSNGSSSTSSRSSST